MQGHFRAGRSREAGSAARQAGPAGRLAMHMAGNGLRSHRILCAIPA